ncbi:hypothetical protein ACTMTF_16740 [Nonomuraea sp. ZG12]|uniref:hypothetical protein n=1 Tax=Nonomuraea sp. ZG12 TaxID=3452207 RepID=UPI003F8B18D1
MSAAKTSGKVSRRPLFGRMYPKMAAAMDEGGMTERRRELLAGPSGEAIEVGAGHGVNFPHYPAEVVQVVAVEPESRLRARAQASAGESSQLARVRRARRSGCTREPMQDSTAP